MEENMMDMSMDTMDTAVADTAADAATSGIDIKSALLGAGAVALVVGIFFGGSKISKALKKNKKSAAKKSKDAAAEEAPVTDGDYREVKPEEEKKAEDKQPENVTAQAEEVKPEEEKKTA